MNPSVIEIALAAIVIPWCSWVTISIFQGKQELAVIQKTHDDLKELIATLIDVFKKDLKRSLPKKR